MVVFPLVIPFTPTRRLVLNPLQDRGELATRTTRWIDKVQAQARHR